MNQFAKEAKLIPGEIFPANGDIVLNESRETINLGAQVELDDGHVKRPTSRERTLVQPACSNINLQS